MTCTRFVLTPLVMVLLATAAPLLTGQTAPRLTAREKAAGWKYLFDGSSLTSWRGYQQNKIPTNWVVRDGVLTDNEAGVALTSLDTWQDFEMIIEWRAEGDAQAGIYYHVTEDFPSPVDCAPGMWLATLKNKDTGGVPNMYQPFREGAKPMEYMRGWNETRIIVTGFHVEHWINNMVVLTYELNSAGFKQHLAASPYAKNKEYGTTERGPIVIQGRGVQFRSIKIHEIP